MRSGPERISSAAPVTSSTSSCTSCRVPKSKITGGGAPCHAWTQCYGSDAGLRGAGARRDERGHVLDLLRGELSCERGHPASAVLDLHEDGGVRRPELVQVRADLSGRAGSAQRVASGAP